ncbi:aldo/keto reductase [bacterium]|nr:aldo/keto reductase [bacterium]
MEYRPLGNTEISVSRICLGTWQAHGWSTSEDSAIRTCIETALDNGVNFIDTAPAYGDGHAERLVGDVTSRQRDRVIIATKVSHSQCTPEKLRSSLESSLRNLQTDYIDLYQQHWPPKRPPLDETIEELNKLKEEGKIRAVGVSNWLEKEWGEISAPETIDCYQPCYSLLWRRIEKNIIPLCQQHTISVLAYSPLCQGILSGKYTHYEQLPPDPRQKNVFRREELFSEVQEFLEVLRSIATQHHRPLTEVALSWVLQQPAITAAIVGCSRPEQVLSAIRGSETFLSQEELSLLTQESADFIPRTERFLSLWNWRPKRP